MPNRGEFQNLDLANIYGAIEPSNIVNITLFESGSSSNAIYTIPAGKKLLIWSIEAIGVGSGTSASQVRYQLFDSLTAGSGTVIKDRAGIS